jgi:hypothetical protein
MKIDPPRIVFKESTSAISEEVKAAPSYYERNTVKFPKIK